MERQPIITEQSEVAAIKLVQSPLTASELLPKYMYQLQSGVISEEAKNMYSELTDFLLTNEELAVDLGNSDRDDYVKGFQKAIALVRLWIDSIYLENP